MSVGVEEPQAEVPDPGELKVGAAVAQIYWDGRQYYCKDNEQWWHHTTESLKRALMVDYDLDSIKHRNDNCTEIDRALRYIEKNQRVAGAVPIVFVPDDIVYLNGQKFLNTSHVRAMPPADEPQEWGKDFPWISSFLEARFLDNERPYMLGWFKRAYMSALAGAPKRGHALFLVGGHNLGKTLFSNKIVGGALGGFADASSHVAKGSEFNKELGETGLWCIDDGEVASDAQSHRRFSEVVKKVVANPVISWRAMRRDPQTIPFNGRLIVTLNADPSSVQMIPDLAISMEEKVMVLRFHDAPFEFVENAVQEQQIREELPRFLRWISDWEMPAEIVGESRLGVKSFINEELRAKALHASGASDLFDLIEAWKKRSAKLEMNLKDKYGPIWQGRATEWYVELCQDDGLRSLVTKFNTKTLGRKFSDAARIPNSGVTVIDADSRRGHIYGIDLECEVERKTVRVTV